MEPGNASVRRVNRAELLHRLRDLRPWLESRGVSELALFGSFARDEAGPDSDVDLLVKLDQSIGLFDLIGLELDLAETLGRSVDLCTEPELNRFVLRRAMKDAVVV